MRLDQGKDWVTALPALGISSQLSHHFPASTGVFKHRPVPADATVNTTADVVESIEMLQEKFVFRKSMHTVLY